MLNILICFNCVYKYILLCYTNMEEHLIRKINLKIFTPTYFKNNFPLKIHYPSLKLRWVGI